MSKDFLELTKRQQYNRLYKTLADCDDNLLPESQCDDILFDDTESDHDDFLDDSDNVSVGSNIEVNDGSNHDCADRPNYDNPIPTTSRQRASSVEEMETDNNDIGCEPSSRLHHDKPQSFREQIISWAMQFGVPRNAVSGLLKILRGHKCFADLPTDSRTLIDTPKNTELRSVHPGYYCHFGLEKGILQALGVSNMDSAAGQQHTLPNIPQSVKVFINIDGIPLTKSSNSQFWPILGALDPLSLATPFTIGVYHGTKKPTTSETFLHDFVSEAKTVLKEGILIGNRTLLVELKGFICDAPARAFIKCIKSHTGYFGCEKCKQEGEYFSNRVVFPEVHCHLRSDEDFRLRVTEDHHLGTSPLESLDIRMVTKFPYEYMHLVCLGVMRKLVFAWIRGKLSVRLSARVVDKLSSLLEMLVPYICREFARKPRTVREIDRFKATEWRQLLLYTGPAVLHKVLPRKMFIHFLALHCAITILVTPGLAVDLNAFAHSLLCSFVENANALYGLEFMSYNVHGLVHLANDVKEFGQLDSFSGFPFENHLQKLKRSVRKSNRPLQQLSNRLIENQNHSRLVQLRANSSTRTPLLAKSGKHLTMRDYTLTTADNDNCCILTDSSVVVINSFLQEGQETFVVGRKFLLLQDLYTTPMKSSLLGIVLASNVSSTIGKWSTSKIQAKAVRLPFKTDCDNDIKFAVFPLRHTS